ncbi:hypothetical protein [Polyangium sp. y55x31]|uniref:hypothetical protein n=1 Tax=Polyangium sp. y55x31 TaxID=3042688 RepID=UPI0024821429|nr:hypothetical protein [Polyangium sp. y55x31]MDI1476832.1 hypothetical protein [Polyangium sp. y55x31]
MASSPYDIENIPGFSGWFVHARDTSGEEPAAVVEHDGIGCTFSRSLTEEERDEVLGFLRNHAEGSEDYRLYGTVRAPLDEVSGMHISELRSAAWGIGLEGGHGDARPSVDFDVVLSFGVRRSAANKKRVELKPKGYHANVVDQDGAWYLIVILPTSRRKEEGTAAEIRQHIEVVRKEIGDVELDAPPIFRIRSAWHLRARAAVEAVRAYLDAAGFTTGVETHAHQKARMWQMVWVKQKPMYDIENLPGFVGWFEGELEAPLGDPATIVEVDRLGCVFSRPPTEDERAKTLGFLRNYIERHKRYEVRGSLTMPLAEISGMHIEKILTALHDSEVDGHDSMSAHLRFGVVLSFGARRDAAEKLCRELWPSVFDAEIVDRDGECFVIRRLFITLQGMEVAEMDKAIEDARKEMGQVALDVPPKVRADLSWSFPERAVAEAVRARFCAAGLTAEVVEEVFQSVRMRLVEQNRCRMLASGSIEDRMRPGVLSMAGFLGLRERLDDVLKEDASTLASLGVTTAEVADRLRPLVGEAISRYWKNPADGAFHVIGMFRVAIHQWRGTQECPWDCDVDSKWSSIDFVIENRRTGDKLRGPGLIVHLIAEHGFFEGKGTRYRVDPRQAVEVLGLPGEWWSRVLRR